VLLNWGVVEKNESTRPPVRYRAGMTAISGGLMSGFCVLFYLVTKHI